MTAARLIAILVLAVASCGRKPTVDNGGDDANVPTDTSSVNDGAATDDAAAPLDASIDARPPIDAFPAVLDMHINCRNDCVLVATPPSISVPAGTEFEVNWINVGDTDCDVAKIDQFNQVPIIIGLEPGTNYHDPVHKWCGTLFTGTFDFRISICTLPSFIPVNCGA